MTQQQQCSALVFGDYRSSRCSRNAVVVRDSKPYCKQHDPEERKRRDEARLQAQASICGYQSGPLAPKCGQPAVKVELTSGRCADHTREALADRQRLNEAAPRMYEYIVAKATEGDAAAKSIIRSIHGHA